MQVQRTSKGSVISNDDLINVVKSVSKQISKEDNVLDICCGNGLITSQVKCKSIIGIDFSKKFIELANENFGSDTQKYICSDALKIDTLFNKKFNKIILNFSFQYFSFKQGKDLINKMSNLLEKNGHIFLSDIPNKEKQNVIAGYGFSKLKYYIKYYLGKEETGKFWSKNELDSISRDLKLKGQYITQPTNLPYSHYRFDYLITKN